jgi:hypothetical protein
MTVTRRTLLAGAAALSTLPLAGTCVREYRT